MANPSIIVPSFSLRIRGVDVLADEVVVRLPVNELATVTVSAHFSGVAASERAIEEPIEQFITEASNLQRYVLNEAPPAVDTRITLETREDGKLASQMTFDGLVAGGGYTLSGNGMSRTYNIVHRAALLGMWNGSIYGRYLDTYLNEEQPISGTVADKIAGVLYRLLNPDIEGGLDAVWRTMGNASVLTRFRQIHAINEQVVGEIRTLLADSSATTDQPLLNAPLGRSHRIEILHFISNALTGQESFLSGLLSVLRPAFGLQFVCDTGRVGLLSNLNLATSNPVPLRVTQSQISTTVGGRREPPLRGLTVESLLPTGYLTQDLGFKVGLPVVLEQYPETFGPGGRVLAIDPPAWLYPDLGLLPKVNGQPDIESQVESQNTATAAAAMASAHIRQILQGWARTNYHYLALLTSRVSVAVPLNLELRPGLVVELINQDNGATLLVGYIEQVEHRVVSRSNAASAGTTLQLSHVQAAGFKLQ